MRYIWFLFCFISFSIFGQTIKSVSVTSVEEYKLQAIKEVNTDKTEFGAYPYENGIVFVHDQKKDLVNFESFDPSGNPYLDLYFSEKSSDKFKKKKVLNALHNSEYHDGPVTFNKDYTKAFLTRAVYTKTKTKGYINQSKLYVIEKHGNKWATPVLFKYDSDEYSLGHASISSDNKKLFFASDMAGGFGGIDVYVCEWIDNDWGKPKNLGPEVNTSANELFPYIDKNGVLFYSSSKMGGLGGLDIYTAKEENGLWKLIRNEGLNINSPGDDFSICFIDSANGYVSSNRGGSDDVFSFNFTKKFIDFEGFVLNSKDLFDPAQNIKLELTDTSGNKISETRSDDNGYFKFHSLNSDETYLVRIDEADPSFSGKKHYFFSDKNNNILRVTKKHNNDNFVFKNLPRDGNSIPDLDFDDNSIIAGNFLTSKDPAKPIAGAKLVLKDEFGNVLEETTTNEFGSFVFTKIQIDEAFLIEFNESDTDIPIGSLVTLTNKSGKTIKTFTYEGNGKFKIQFLPSEKTSIAEMQVNDADVVFDFKCILYDENNNPLSNLIVYLKDQEKNASEKISTDANAKLSLKKLLTDKNYLLEFDESDERLSKIQKIIIKSAKGKTIKEIIRVNGKFSYHILAKDKNELNEFYVDDPWLSVLDFKNSAQKQEIIIEENVYYAYGDYHIDEAGRKVLDKIIKIMQDNPKINIELGSHTDSRSNDGYNLKLSDRRAKEAVSYLIGHGISKSRLKAIGYGETKLKNKCANDIDCSEEEHAQNRRTEFKVVSKK